jgi:hypothetical protein
MTDLRTFLSEMALDPAKFAEFLREPESAIRAHDLSKEDREALLSGIPAMIWARLAAYLTYPPPYYTPSLIYVESARPTWVTSTPLMSGSPPLEGKPPIKYVTAAPLYVTATPPLYLPGSPPPHVVSSPPQFVVADTPRERPAPASPKTPPKRSR